MAKKPAFTEPSADVDLTVPLTGEQKTIPKKPPVKQMTPAESVRQAHFQRQKEGVAHLMKPEDAKVTRRKAFLEEIEAHNVANRKRWDEERKKAAERQRKDNVKAMKAEIKDLQSKIKDLDAEIKAAEGEEELV